MKTVRLARLGMVWIGLWLTALLPLLAAATHAEHSFKPAAYPAYLYTGEQIDPDLGMYYLRARYYQPGIGRFWSLDSYEGNQTAPLSLHKYLYCHANPVNHIDPSGHFLAVQINTGAIQSQLGTSLATAAIRVPGHIAARGFTKWAWVIGGIGAGLQTMTEDTEFGIDTQIDLMLNPTGSQSAYITRECDMFARDAMTFFRGRGLEPKRITFDCSLNITPGFIYAERGFFKGQIIADNAHHEGVLAGGRVYDNNMPFGVKRRVWEESYSLVINNAGEMTIGEAARRGFGQIRVD